MFAAGSAARLVQQRVEDLGQAHHLAASFGVVVDMGAAVGMQTGVAAADRDLIRGLIGDNFLNFLGGLDGVVEGLSQNRAVYDGHEGIEADGFQVAGNGFRQARLVHEVSVAGEGHNLDLSAFEIGIFDELGRPFRIVRVGVHVAGVTNVPFYNPIAASGSGLARVKDLANGLAVDGDGDGFADAPVKEMAGTFLF